MIGVKAVSAEPYYYTKKPEGKVLQSYIEFNLTQIANVSFVENTAPTFAQELESIIMTVNETMTINLPDIFDPDSEKAYIYSMFTFPMAKFVRIQNSKMKTNNNITISPTQN